MTNLDLGKMFGDSNQEMQKAAALKTYLVKLDEILPSEENPYEVEEESVQRLAENIEQYGLFQALTVQKEGSEIRLISGERRFTSLKYLTDTGKTYTYNGADITGYAPVSYVKQTVGDAKTMMMISANAHRDMQAGEKNHIIETAINSLEKQVLSGKFSWEGKRKATVLAAITGIKEHYIKDYLAKKNKEIKFATDDENVGGETPPEENADEIKAMESILKGIATLNKKLKNYDELDFNLLDIKKINTGIIESQLLMDSIEKLSNELQRLSSNK